MQRPGPKGAVQPVKKRKEKTDCYLSIYGSTVLLLDLGRFFSFLILDSLDGGWACRKAAAYTHNNTNTE
jgi:hypothetical protein